MGRGKKGKGQKKSMVMRWRGYEWAGVPEKGTNASWDLFLACGQSVLQVLEGHRFGSRWWDRHNSLLDLLNLEEGPVAAGGDPMEVPPGDMEEGHPEGPEDAETPQATLQAGQVAKRHTAQKPVELIRAMELLTRNPSETFPFLFSPEAPAPPPHAVLLTSVLCARYVLEGLTSPLENLRPLLALFERLPHKWETLGKSLACYCRRKSAWIKLQVEPDVPSGLDGAIILATRAYRELLGIAPIQMQDGGEWAGEGFPGRLRRTRRFRPPSHPWPRSRKDAGEEARMARVSRPKLNLDDLFLPLSLKQEIQLLVSFCKRKASAAPTLLFHGAPGTGKTHAATAFAGALGRKLATANSARLQDRYVGETEKHLEQVFQEAARARAVLLLDEADALLHSRELAQRSWEVSCVNVLLKLLENPKVPVVLCTNFVDKLDPALNRRIHNMLAFPVPSATERRGIWERELRVAKFKADVDLEKLAQVSLSGGLIANAVHQARVRRNILGRAFKLTTASFLGLAEAERPKMLGAEGAGVRKVGFGA